MVERDAYSEPSRHTFTSTRVESALTTETPTPCRPPDTLYPSPPNLPPACRMVRTTSTVGIFSFGMLVHRNAAAVVHHRDGVVGMYPHLDPVAVAGQRLVHGVVHHLVHQMVQAARPRGTNVHARALAHRLEPFEYLNVRTIVMVRFVHHRHAPFTVRCLTGTPACGMRENAAEQGARERGRRRTANLEIISQQRTVTAKFTAFEGMERPSKRRSP